MGFNLIPKTQIFVQELGLFFTAFKSPEPNIFNANVIIPENNDIDSKIYTLEVYANDKATGISIPITVYPKSESIEYYQVIGLKGQPSLIGSEGGNINVMVYFSLDDPFIAVVDIDGLPTEAILLGNGATHEIDLSKCMVEPMNATNRTIEWSINDPGTTGATLEGYVLKLSNIGIVSVKAIVTNGESASTDFTKIINIIMQPIAVEDITGIPATFTEESNYVLEGIVSPDNARNKTISWNVVDPGVTGAIIENNILLASDPGEVKIKATIKDGLSIGHDYVKEFTMTAEHAPHISVTDITLDVPTRFNVGTELALTGTVIPDNAKNQDINWSIISDSGTSTVIEGNVLKSAIATGTITVRATITGGICNGIQDTDYTKDFNISITNGKDNGDNIYCIIGKE